MFQYSTNQKTINLPLILLPGSNFLGIAPLRAVARLLDEVQLHYAFTGGAVVNLLLDNLDLAPARVTDDVDVIVEIVSGMK